MHLVVVQQQRQVLACLRRLPRHLVVTPLPRHLALFLRPVWQLLPLVHLVARALVAHPPHQRRQSPLHLVLFLYISECSSQWRVGRLACLTLTNGS